MKIKSKAKWRMGGMRQAVIHDGTSALSFQSPLMESCGRLPVTLSRHQERLITVLNIDLCLTRVKIPPTL